MTTAFSALDFKTDSKLRKALKEKTKDITTIIVAQRISTILNADQIIVLDDGNMAGIGHPQGTDEELRGLPPDRHVTAFRGGISMSENKARGPMMGGHRSRAMNSGEKAKDFKGAMKRLLKYMERYKIRFVLMFLFAIAGTIFNIVGPKILGKATTELFNGLVAKVNGTGSIDFEKIWLYFVMDIRTVSGKCLLLFYPGLCDDRNFQRRYLQFT